MMSDDAYDEKETERILIFIAITVISLLSAH